MNIKHFTLDHEELISDAFALPGGRCVFAELEQLPSVPVGNSPKEPDSLQLVVEVRATPQEEFKEVMASHLLTEPGQVRVQIPTPAAAIEFCEPVPVARLRVVHQGRMHPRYEVRLVGL